MDEKFIKDAQAVHAFMKKANVSFNCTIDPTLNMNDVYEKAPNSARVPEYDNVNKVNHLPFADDDNTIK